jgi:hypothetical protein
MVYTYHTYPDLLYKCGRHARTDWEGYAIDLGVAATIKHDPDAVVLSVRSGDQRIVGYAPGGINA